MSDININHELLERINKAINENTFDFFYKYNGSELLSVLDTIKNDKSGDFAHIIKWLKVNDFDKNININFIAYKFIEFYKDDKNKIENVEKCIQKYNHEQQKKFYSEELEKHLKLITETKKKLLAADNLKNFGKKKDNFNNISEFKIRSSNQILHILWNNDFLDKKYIKGFFDSIICTDRLIYCFIKEKKCIHKWYNKPMEENSLPLSEIEEIIENPKREEGIYIYMSKNDKMLLLFVDFDKSIIKYSNTNQDIFDKQFIIDSLPSGIKIRTSNPTDISGMISIYGVYICKEFLSHFLMNNDVINRTVYINEYDRIMSIRLKLIIRFFSYPKIKCSFIENYKLENDKEITDMDKNKIIIKSGVWRTRLSLTNIDNMTMLKNLQILLYKLFSYYKYDYENNKEFYGYGIFEKDLLDSFHAEIVKKDKVSYTITNNKLLREKFPTIFMANYTSDCQNRLVSFIEKDKIEEWEKQTFTRYVNKKKIIYNRKVLPFPIDSKEPKGYFICNSDKNPFIGLVTGKNGEKMPCCFAKEKNAKRSIKEEKNSQKSILSYKTTYIIKTNTPLITDQRGVVKGFTKSVINIITNNTYNVYRNGVYVPEYDNDSFIFALLKILSTSDINGHKLKEATDYYIKKSYKDASYSFRKKLSKMHLELGMEQLYDFSEKKIKEFIKTGKIEYEYFSRLCEYLCGFKIHVFEKDKLIFPRFFEFLSPKDDFKNFVIINRTTHYEPVSINDRFIFVGTNYIDKLYDIFYWLFTRSMNFSRKIIYQFNYPDLKSYIDMAKYQFIDNTGHCQGLEIKNVDEKITVFFPPIAPLNLKRKNKVKHYSSLSAEELESLKMSITALSINNEEIDGIWRGVLFFPIVPIDIKNVDIKDIEIKPHIHYKTSKINIKNINKERIKFLIFREIITWLFLIYKKNNNISFDDFIQCTFLEYKEKYIDYNFSNIPENIPEIYTLEEGINWLGEYCPDMVNDKRILLYNVENHNLYDKIIYFLRNKDIQYENMDILIPTKIEFRYETLKNYKKHINNKISYNIPNKLNYTTFIKTIDNDIFKDNSIKFYLSEDMLIYQIVPVNKNINMAIKICCDFYHIDINNEENVIIDITEEKIVIPNEYKKNKIYIITNKQCFAALLIYQ